MRSRGLFLTLGLLGMLVLSATSAHAATFSGCFKNTPGKPSKVRSSSVLVDQTPACKSTETLHSWNEEGPQGPPGITTCHPEEFPGTAPAGTFGVTNMFCSSGHATGAGFLWTTPFDGADNGTGYFFPRGDNFWTCVAYNHTGAPSNYKCYLQCCS